MYGVNPHNELNVLVMDMAAASTHTIPPKWKVLENGKKAGVVWRCPYGDKKIFSSL